MAIRKVHPGDVKPRWEPQDEIILERKIHIARIAPSPDGTESMIASAFLMIGQYMADNDDVDGYEIEFQYAGRTFLAALSPANLPDRKNGQAADEDYD